MKRRSEKSRALLRRKGIYPTLEGPVLEDGPGWDVHDSYSLLCHLAPEQKHVASGKKRDKVSTPKSATSATITLHIDHGLTCRG